VDLTVRQAPSNLIHPDVPPKKDLPGISMFGFAQSAENYGHGCLSWKRVEEARPIDAASTEYVRRFMAEKSPAE